MGLTYSPAVVWGLPTIVYFPLETRSWGKNELEAVKEVKNYSDVKQPWIQK